MPYDKYMSKPSAAAIEGFTRRMFTRIITSLAVTLREDELSVAQVAALYLVDEKKTLRIGDVAAALDRSAPSTSRLIDDLVERGLLERREDPDDRRARTLTLTPAGSRFIARAGEARIKTIFATAHELPESASAFVLAFMRGRKDSKEER